MDFNELRTGHKIKCVRESPLLPFKAGVEYKVTNVLEGSIEICDEATGTKYPLDASLCMNYFEFTPAASVIYGFRRPEPEKQDDMDESEVSNLKKLLFDLSMDDLDIIQGLSDDYGMAIIFMKLAECFEKVKNYFYSGSFDIDTLKERLVDMAKTIILSLIVLEEGNNEDNEGNSSGTS